MKSFSELTSASQVNNEDLLAISQTSGSGYASKKTTVKDITDKSNLNLAEEYDSTSTYAVDDYVIYESVLYKCTASTTGTFDSTKWTAVVVTDEMGSGGGGGTGGHTIIDENGNSMTARAGLQFVGGANVEDDSTNNRTIVDLASAGGIDGVFIDTDNVVKDDFTIDGTNHEWIATEDCFIYAWLLANDQYTSAYLNIDGESAFVTLNYSIGETTLISIKKGQTLGYRSKSGSYTRMKAYGIQTGTTHSKFQPVIYSTEEREVGVWTDGKPLYEKTWDFGSDIVCTSNSWTDIPITKGDIEKIVNIKAVNNAGTIWDMLGANTNQTYVQVYHNRGSNNAISIRYATLQYTKTTDVAGSGSWTPQGVPTHHYSTDEQVIGTWIDGSTLYEKTISSDLTLSTASWQNYTSLADLNLLSVDKVIITRDGEQVPMAFLPYMIVAWIVRDNYLKFIIQSSTSVAETIVLKSCTIQYTKTS